ncbi:hypothetical protein BRADI_2g31220v3 [Brachypodium distachyon]|uniref:Uncharacterized protein n=1 Tax=Brachypodium distachyon TaxID=15368 RepID=I1HKN4_BRADI|nr:hypothetical protein BRADI_2g31220v3 [Brachypodium distachyon]
MTERDGSRFGVPLASGERDERRRRRLLSDFRRRVVGGGCAAAFDDDGRGDKQLTASSVLILTARPSTEEQTRAPDIHRRQQPSLSLPPSGQEHTAAGPHLPFTDVFDELHDRPHSSIVKGAYAYDINGKKYIDALAGLWCTALGGNEPRLVKAATDQLNKLSFYHSFWNRTTKPSLDLANDILNMFTAREMGKVFFTNSGSEANDSQCNEGYRQNSR